MATPRTSRRRQPVRNPQPSPPRRPGLARSADAPPDYTRDYEFVRRDLILIAIIGGLLFAGMVVASFVL